MTRMGRDSNEIIILLRRRTGKKERMK